MNYRYYITLKKKEGLSMEVHMLIFANGLKNFKGARDRGYLFDYGSLDEDHAMFRIDPVDKWSSIPDLERWEKA